MLSLRSILLAPAITAATVIVACTCQSHLGAMIISADRALPGRSTPMVVSPEHTVLRAGTKPPFPADTKTIVLGMGCYWGAERLFWRMEGVYSTQVGFAGGHTPNPTYREVCTGNTGHTEVVRVVYRPAELPLTNLLAAFWESHNPTQGMRQGNDVGTQYRSAIYYTDAADAPFIAESMRMYGEALASSNKRQLSSPISTEVAPLREFYYAEDEHQQYLHKQPDGYCGLKGTGVACPMPKK